MDEKDEHSHMKEFEDFFTLCIYSHGRGEMGKLLYRQIKNQYRKTVVSL